MSTALGAKLRKGWVPTSYAEAVSFLYDDLKQARETLFREGDGFARSGAYLELLGNPQESVRTIHVAGTAGKGTVCYEAACILDSHGVSVGLHVSPHVYDLRERFQVNGDLCSEDDVVYELTKALPAIATMSDSSHGPPTFFEVTVGLALTVFVRKQCEVAVLETGLGGTYDATNTICRTDKVAVVTRIDYDHEAVLGHTLREIAGQKAGILTRDGVAFAARSDEPEVNDVLSAEARNRRCRLHFVEPDMRSGVVRHLAEDRALATAAAGAILEGVGKALDQKVAGEALECLRIPGRFEVGATRGSRPVILDGAHNPVKMFAFVDRLKNTYGSSVEAVWVFACKEDKNAVEMMRIAKPHVRELILTQFTVLGGDVPYGESSPPNDLLAKARECGLGEKSHVSADFEEAALRAATTFTELPIVVTGSFYLLELLKPLLAGPPMPDG